MLSPMMFRHKNCTKSYRNETLKTQCFEERYSFVSGCLQSCPGDMNPTLGDSLDTPVSFRYCEPPYLYLI